MNSDSMTSYRELRVLDRGCWVDGIPPSNQILWFLPQFSFLRVALNCSDEAIFLFDPCEAKLDRKASRNQIHKNRFFTIP